MEQPQAYAPFVIGVTGHHDLRAEDAQALRALVGEALKAIRLQCAPRPLLMLSSLCEGGDQLCAGVGLALGVAQHAALPMPLPQYAADFKGTAREALYALIEQCETAFTVPRTELPLPGAPTREALQSDAYRQASLYVAAHCDVLLALWDGAAHTPNGCGTAETVAAARGSLAVRTADGDATVLHKPRAVVHILTPRRTRPRQTVTPGFALPLWQALGLPPRYPGDTER